MRAALIIFFIAIAFLHSTRSSAQLTITQHSTAQELAQKLVGDGVSITNVSFTGRIEMASFFNNRGGTNIGIDSGIVLTNGRAGFTSGPSSSLANTHWSLPGDAQLSAQISEPTEDACVLEFDFIPLGDSIKFNYVFSSEEYDPAYVCDFNDAFAFFISGPGITGIKNIALVPTTTTPVSIKNVNNVPGGGCPSNTAYYIDNDGNTFFTHDGLTTVLTALEKVQPCQPYHLKLVIADASGDDEFDTGVFLQAKSLTSNAIGMNNLTQTDPATGLSYLVEGCISGAFNIRRPKKDPFPLTVNLLYAGTALNSIDVSTLPSSVTIPANDSFVTIPVNPLIDGVPEGIEEIKVYALAGCASITPTDSTVIQIRDYDILALTPDTAIICSGHGITLNASPGYTTYDWQADPTLSSTSIHDPVATPVNNETTYYCTANIGTCYAKDSVFLQMKDMEFISKKDVSCRNGNNGQIKVAAGPEWIAPIEFSLDGVNWQPDSTFNNLPTGIYWVKLKGGSCIDSVQVTIDQEFPDLSVTSISATAASCSGNPDGTITIAGNGGNGAYSYSSDGINFQAADIFNVIKGTYTITIKDGNGCLATDDIDVPLNNTVTVDAGPDETICEGASFIIPAVSNGTSYAWWPVDNLDDAVSLTPSANPSSTTKYYITAVSGVCTNKDSMQLFIRPAPLPDAGDDINICYGKIFKLDASGGVTYQWSPSTYFISPTNIPNPDVKAMGDISYSLMITDAFNCKSLVPDIVKINVVPSVKIFAGNDTIAAINQPIKLLVKELSTAGVTTYTWTPSTYLSDAGSPSPVATLLADQRFIVTGTTADGCQGLDDIIIKVYKGPDIYTPTGFTPNNDGLNDILRPVAVGIKDFKFFRVYNRAGQLVFSTQDPKRGWDGKVNGVTQSPGTFVWMAEGIDYKGNPVVKKGVVTIIL